VGDVDLFSICDHFPAENQKGFWGGDFHDVRD
jgi:hypothetical protein